MLKVDLGVLKRLKRLEIDELVPADTPFLEGTGLTFEGPLQVYLDLELLGEEVVAGGRVSGKGVMDCRRCLNPVEVTLDHPMRFSCREGITEVEAEAEEEFVYAVPAKAREIDLMDAIREHVVLGLPEYAECREDCKGLCPHCGTNLNETKCDCTADPVDDRWAALKRVKLD
jgi:uncharacterized protein